MTDWRALCAELLGALENEGHAHWPGGPDGDPLIEQARAALAEPQGEGLTDELQDAIDAYDCACRKLLSIAAKPDPTTETTDD